MHRRAGENEKKLYRSNNVMKTQTEELHNLKVLLKKKSPSKHGDILQKIRTWHDGTQTV